MVVPSEFSERIVGCADPDDDSLVWWAIIEEGQPPKQARAGTNRGKRWQAGCDRGVLQLQACFEA